MWLWVDAWVGGLAWLGQIVFLLTAGRIQAKFSSSASYDLRDLLGATHNVLAGEPGGSEVERRTQG